jgi:transcriptional regulator with XRE-family HTH domain
MFRQCSFPALAWGVAIAHFFSKPYIRDKSLSITNQIPQVCRRKGLTTAYQLAMRCGIKRTTAYRLWDNPEAYPTRKTMMKLCDGLGVTPGTILILGSQET